MQRKICINEALNVAEDLKKKNIPTKSPITSYHTEVTMWDNTGRICFRQKPNLVVLRGRTFVLEKIFNLGIGTNGVTGGSKPYISTTNFASRRIAGFVVGNGGASAGDKFVPDAPLATDLALTSQLLFRIHDPSTPGGGPFAFISSPNDREKYAAGVSFKGSETNGLYIKGFDTTSWVHEESQNEVYLSLNLSITEHDTRESESQDPPPEINELGLIFANRGDVTGEFFTVTEDELFSRITFPTERMYAAKSLALEYRIYA